MLNQEALPKYGKKKILPNQTLSIRKVLVQEYILPLSPYSSVYDVLQALTRHIGRQNEILVFEKLSEKVKMYFMQTKVVKRNGMLEAFNKNKIKKVVKATGLEEDQANKLALKLENWVERKGLKEISSLAIRDQVVKELGKVNTYSANLYKWYQKTKE